MVLREYSNPAGGVRRSKHESSKALVFVKFDVFGGLETETANARGFVSPGELSGAGQRGSFLWRRGPWWSGAK
jgi:hypothetical protein